VSALTVDHSGVADPSQPNASRAATAPAVSGRDFLGLLGAIPGEIAAGIYSIVVAVRWLNHHTHTR
jgi:hypothetical protein